MIWIGIGLVLLAIFTANHLRLRRLHEHDWHYYYIEDVRRCPGCGEERDL